MTQLKENQNDIILEFENYRQIGTTSFVFPRGKRIISVKGKNKAGKTGILKFILAITQAKRQGQPLTFEEIDGEKVFTNEDGKGVARHFPGPNGKEYTIEWYFDQEKDKFTAYDEETGKKIKSVKEIRELFGISEMSAEDIFHKSFSAKGKREIMDTLKDIIQQVNPEQHDKIIDLEKKVDVRNGTLFLQRKEKKANKEALERTITEVSKPDYDYYEELKSTIAEVDKEIEGINKAKEENQDKEHEIESLSNRIAGINESIKIKEAHDSMYEKEIKRLQKLLSEEERKKEENGKQLALQADERRELSQLYNQKTSELKDAPTLSENDRYAYENAKTERDTLEKHIEQYNNYNNQKEKLTASADEYIKAEQKLEDAREQLRKTYNNLDLPFNVTVKDEELFIEGMELDPAHQSKSEMMKIAITLLLYKNKSPLIVLGEADDFDNDSLKEVIELLEQHGYIMVTDEVDREGEDIKVITYDKTNL